MREGGDSGGIERDEQLESEEREWGETGVAKGVLRYSLSSKTTSHMFYELVGKAQEDTIAPEQYQWFYWSLFFFVLLHN